MASLSAAYLAEIAKIENTPDVIVSVELDSGTVKYGWNSNFSDVLTVLGRAASFQNRINPKDGYSTLGTITFEIIGRENFKDLIQVEFLKNRRITKYEGFKGIDFADYLATFTGIISDWRRKGDVLTITASDDMQPATKSVPVENATKTQYIDFSNSNPVDVMQTLILTHAGVPAGKVDTATFDSERDTWMNGWKIQRVLTTPKKIKQYLNELQEETNSFIVHDGELITYKVLAPVVPGQTIPKHTDTNNIILNSVSQGSGYLNNFYNRIVFYYDYDESGTEDEEHFDSAFIVTDADSLSSAEWDETNTKTIKSKWFKTYTFDQPSNITGLVLYHVSKANGAGAGTLTYNNANNTLQWTAPGGSIGAALELSKDGKLQVYDADRTKYCRVVVTTASLPGGNQTDTITTAIMNGPNLVSTIAGRLLNRYRDPASTISYKVGLNDTSYNGDMIKPTDIIDLTTDEACTKDFSTLVNERVMLLSAKPGRNEIGLEVMPTRQNQNAGFIAPAGFSDYEFESESNREYAFIGRASDNTVFDGSGQVPGKSII